MFNEIRSVGIRSAGFWVPEKILTNSDLTKILDVTDDWIQERTGITHRRIIAPEDTTSDLALRAAQKALANGGLKPEDIDCIIVTTSTPDYFFPSTACVVQHKLKATRAAAFDLFAACAGFIYGLNTGYSMVASGYYKNVMVIGAEALTRFVNWEDKNTSILFGDGAGCVILSPNTEHGELVSFTLGADGHGSSVIIVPAGGSRMPASEETVKNKLHYISMDGRETYRTCIRTMTTSILDILDKQKLELSDIDYIITHQANLRIIEGIIKRLSIPEEKVHINVTYLGNTAAASIPIGLCECIEQNKFKPGDKVLLATFGAGFAWGSCIMKW